MCTLCDKFSRRNYDNKYFGWSRMRWLSFYGERWYYKHFLGNKLKFHPGYPRSEEDDSKRSKRGGWMRKGNGVFGWMNKD